MYVIILFFVIIIVSLILFNLIRNLFFFKRRKNVVIPAYIITEPAYFKDKEIVTFVKSFTYTINYPIEVI